MAFRTFRAGYVPLVTLAVGWLFGLVFTRTPWVGALQSAYSRLATIAAVLFLSVVLLKRFRGMSIALVAFGFAFVILMSAFRAEPWVSVTMALVFAMATADAVYACPLFGSKVMVFSISFGAYCMLFTAVVLLPVDSGPTNPDGKDTVVVQNPVEPLVRPPVAKPMKPTRTQTTVVFGTITVPEAGLRKEHSFDSLLQPCRLVIGQRVRIIDVYTPASGPRWTRIRTGGGIEGWVPGSVVEREGRLRTGQ